MIPVVTALGARRFQHGQGLYPYALALLVAAISFAPIGTFAQAPEQVVISQVYGGGGNNGAPFRNDFVELLNRGTNTTSLVGWTVQYASSTSGNWQSTSLSNSIAPGQYFLLQLASGGANGVFLPLADTTGTLSLSAGAGKVALVQSTAILSGICPTDPDIVDLVGYGSAAACFEGSGPVANPANAIAAHRASGGCLDSDNNSLDFYLAAPTPRNRSSPTNPCRNEVPVLALHTIQGGGTKSPFVGQFITTTTNVVTAVLDEGFFLQSRDDETDGNPATSEAIYVATPPVILGITTVGNGLVVAGIVDEDGDANTSTPTRTQIINPRITLISNNQTRPNPVTVMNQDSSPNGTPDPFERYEAMRIQVNSLTVVAPTEGFINETNAQGTSDGVFYGVSTGTPRPMREPGIPILDPLPNGAPPNVPRFDGNPERLRVDSNAQTGAPRREVTSGAVVSNLVGVLDFADDVWTILPDAGVTAPISGNISAIPVPVATSNELTVASFNLERFFDTDDDPAVDETILTPAAFTGRLNKASLAIRNVLRAPDILGIIEIENLTTLETLATKLNTDAVTAGQPAPNYRAWLERGNDVGGINVGFLVRTSRVAVLEVTQLGRTNTYLNPLTGLPETLNDRPSLLLRGTIPRPGSSTPLAATIILNHLRSMSGITDATDGARIRAKRRAQAEYLAGVVQERQASTPSENLVLIGDFNAFQFNDGYADLIGTIKGNPTPANLVTLASADLVQPDLINLIDELPADQRYSFSFDGNAQALDHILVNASMHPRVARCAYARSNADFPESFRNNFNRPERISDHDAPVAYFTLNVAPRFLTIERLAEETIQLQWIGEPNQTNRIEASLNLKDWTLSGTVVTGSDGAAIFTNSDFGGAPQGFYRIAAP